MSDFFSFLFFLAFICLVIGLIKPGIFGSTFNRKKVGKIFGIACVACFVLIGIFIEKKPDTSKSNETSVQSANREINIATKKEFFEKLIAAEKKAGEEADEMYEVDITKPKYKKENLLKNAEKNKELMDKYKGKVREKYGITEKEEGRIVAEAIKNNWPR